MTEVAEFAGRIRGGIARVVVGNEQTTLALLVALVGGGHLLIEGVPGTAKTLLVRLLAQLLDVTYRRIQFTPDLMPSDVVGTNVFNAKSGDFALRRGPVFTNVLLADEINRTPPKTQSALLEAMEERQVTIDGEDAGAAVAVPRLRDAEPRPGRGHHPCPKARPRDRFRSPGALRGPGLSDGGG